MKNQPTVPWLTMDMSNTGLTPTTLAYLTGTSKELPADLPIKEFLLIRSIQGEKFEATDFYKTWVKQFTNRDTDLDPALKQLAAENDDVIGFLKDYLPVMYAAEFCTYFYEYYRLWKRAGNSNEKEFLLKKIRETISLEKLSQDDLLWYREITVEFPADHVIANLAISIFILNNKRDVYYLSKKIELSKFQLESFTKKIIEKQAGLDEQELFEFYIKTKKPEIMEFLIKKITDQKEHNRWVLPQLFNRIKETVAGTPNKTEHSALILLLFPLTIFVIKNLDGTDLAKDSVDKIIDILPPYKKENGDIEEIVQRVRKYYESYQYVDMKGINLWYAYTKDKTWIDMLIDKIQKNDYMRFNYAIDLFKTTKLKRVITIAIECIPTLTAVDEDRNVLPLLEWLKPQTSNKWYQQVKDIIISNNLLEKWWAEATKGPRYTKEVIKIMAHFQ